MMNSTASAATVPLAIVGIDVRSMTIQLVAAVVKMRLVSWLIDSLLLIQMRMALELHLGVTMGETYPVEAPGTRCWYRSKNGGLDMHGRD
jgi:hypothetical protein